MHRIDKIFINNNENRIETELFLSNTENSPFVFLICHPHPQFFGI